MNIQRKFSISGVGKYLPKSKVPSSVLEREMGMPDGWIHERMGVHSRHIAETETNTQMGAAALNEALKDAKLQIGDLDCLIAASATFDYVLPNRSCLIKKAFADAKNHDFPCVDINTVCTSFMSALDYASMQLMCNDYQHIAIVSSEISSKGLNPNDKEPFSLFGDAAAAVIISKTEKEGGLMKYQMKTYSENATDTIIEGGGNVFHPRDYAYDPVLFSFKMEGRRLLLAAGKELPNFFEGFYESMDTTLETTDWIVPHQASKMGLKMLGKINGKCSNIVNQLPIYGNCIAASIPLALVTQIQDGIIKENQSCMMIGTAAGLSIGGCLIRYVR